MTNSQRLFVDEFCEAKFVDEKQSFSSLRGTKQSMSSSQRRRTTDDVDCFVVPLRSTPRKDEGVRRTGVRHCEDEAGSNPHPPVIARAKPEAIHISLIKIIQTIHQTNLSTQDYLFQLILFYFFLNHL